MSSKVIVVWFVVAALGFALAALVVERSSPNQQAHGTFNSLLAERRALDQEIARHALEARFAFDSNYDQLAADGLELRQLEQQLRGGIPSFLGRAERADIEGGLVEYAELSEQYWRLVERFKSQNALLRNSVDYFPSLASTVLARAHEPALVASINELRGSTLNLALKNDRQLATSQNEWATKVTELTAGKLAKADQREVDLMLAHARAIALHKHETDLLLARLLELPLERARRNVSRRYEQAYAGAERRGHLFGGFVSVFALLLLAIVAYAGLRLRQAAVGLSRANERLEAAVLERTAQLTAELAENARMEIELRHAQKLEAVGQLAAGIAHEINTPIQYIGDSVHFLREAFTDTMRLVDAYQKLVAGGNTSGTGAAGFALLAQDIDIEFLKAEVPEALERTTHGTKQVASIVRAMKTFAQTSMDKAPLDLNAALENTLIVARNEYRDVADVETVFTEIPEVTCDASSMRQVFLSLIVNAAHAIADKVGESGKRGTITVRSERREGQIVIAIADTGAGIAEAIQGRVFDPFFTTREPGRGSGQGLTISQSIVKQHAGKLWFETELGVGTSFFVQLPIEATVSRLERKAL